MLRATLLLLLASLLLSAATCFGQQRQTTWLGGPGDWYEEGAWTEGIPTPVSTVHIPDGQVVVPPGENSPSILAMNIASVEEAFGFAEVLIEDNNLFVTSQLTIGESNESTALGILTVLGDGQRSGNVSLDSLRVGIANGRTGEADGMLEITGDLRLSGKEPGSLLVGQNTSHGFANGTLLVGNAIGNLEFGFVDVTIGHVSGGGGTAIGEVNASSLSYGSGQIQVGLNTSNDRNTLAVGRLSVNELHGYDQAFFGRSELGNAFATVDVHSFYNVGETELGSPNGNGRAQFTLGDEATLGGTSVVVNHGSSLSLGVQMDAELVNHGRTLVTNRPDGLPGGIVKMSNLVRQTETGVLELDVAGPERGIGYEAVDIADGGTLDGRLQINFVPGYQPSEGDTFEFVQSQGPLDVKELDWSFRNAPRDFAVEFFADGNVLLAKLVKPAAQDFVNAVGTDFQWQDDSIWTKNRLPTSTDDIVMQNSRGQSQSVRTDAESIVRSLAIDGVTSPMQLHVSERSSLTATHGIQVRSLGEIELSNGKITTDMLRVDAEAILRGQGQISGDVVNQGLVDVGLTLKPSTLTIDGNLTQLPQGWLEMDILGTKEGEYDQIIVDGRLDLAGTLNLNLPDLGSIGPNVQIPLLQASDGILGGLELQFDNRVGEIPLGLRTLSDPESGDTTIMFISGPGPGVLGDMNWDLSVDECDLDAFALSLQDVDTYTDFYVFEPSHIGDINDDGVFDVDDIRPFFDLVNGVGCASEALPEPDSAHLLLLSWLTMLGMRLSRKEVRRVR